MLIIVPVIIGLLACMPVPIGNPERSRVDPEITGAWFFAGDGDPAFYVFEPWDKRTWLLAGVPLEEGADADFGDYNLESDEELARLIAAEPVGENGATATETVLYKAWMTKLGGVWFMTWEPKGLFGSEQFAPDSWFVFRVEKPDQETLELTLIGGKKFFPDDLEKTRRAYERVIKKHAKNPEMYTEEPWPLVKVADEHMGFFEDLAEEVIAHSD
jgi:hypothetical protein